ncbi:hypothetical protein [Roseicyclus sp.]|jgi:hypothetical protein
MFVQIASIVANARATLVTDALGIAAIAALTLGLLHLPALV